MKKNATVLLGLSLMFFLIWLSAPASGINLYVHNQEFEDKVAVVKGVPYASAESLLKALRSTWCQSGTIVEVKPAIGQGEPAPALVGDTLSFRYGDASFSPAMFRRNGVLYVSVPDIAKGFQLKYEFNPDTGIADLVRPRIPTAAEIQEAAASPAPSATPGAGSAGEEEEKESPLELKVEAMAERDMSGNWAQYFRPHATVKNISQDVVKNIVATLHYKDGAGNDLFKEEWTIGDLDPGKMVAKDFVWSNYSGVEVRVMLTEKHEKKKKEEKK